LKVAVLALGIIPLVAELLRRALLMRDQMKEQGWSLRKMAGKRSMTPAWVCKRIVRINARMLT